MGLQGLQNMPNLTFTNNDLPHSPTQDSPPATITNLKKQKTKPKKRKKPTISPEPQSRPAHATYTYSTEAEIVTLTAALTWHRQFTGAAPPSRTWCPNCCRYRMKDDEEICSECLANEQQWARDEDIDDKLMAKLRAYRSRKPFEQQRV